MGNLDAQESCNSQFQSSSSPSSFNSHMSLTTALTNMKLGREMKLCDPTNIDMFKSIYFLESNNKQPQAIHYKGGMYVHVTDKEKHCGRPNLIHGQISVP